jgi:hypothetical protein
VTKIEQLREMLKEADCPHFDAYSEEGQDGAGRYIHSLCGHEGDMLDDRGHVCFGHMFGDSREQAATRAVFVADAIESLPKLLDELTLLRRMAAASELLFVGRRVPMGTPGWEVAHKEDPQREFEETLKDWVAYWKSRP